MIYKRLLLVWNTVIVISFNDVPSLCIHHNYQPILGHLNYQGNWFVIADLCNTEKDVFFIVKDLDFVDRSSPKHYNHEELLRKLQDEKRSTILRTNDPRLISVSCCCEQSCWLTQLCRVGCVNVFVFVSGYLLFTKRYYYELYRFFYFL